MQKFQAGESDIISWYDSWYDLLESFGICFGTNKYPILQLEAEHQVSRHGPCPGWIAPGPVEMFSDYPLAIKHGHMEIWPSLSTKISHQWMQKRIFIEFRFFRIDCQSVQPAPHFPRTLQDGTKKLTSNCWWPLGVLLLWRSGIQLWPGSHWLVW